MKTPIRSVIALSCTLGALGLTSACTSGPFSSNTPGSEIASAGPTVVDAKANPSTFELNQLMQPLNPPQIMANVKDFSGNVTKVTLRFTNAPLELPMTQINPSTWTAELSQDQLKQLAVSGQTMKYDAKVIATDDHGRSAVGDKGVDIVIKAPSLTSSG